MTARKSFEGPRILNPEQASGFNFGIQYEKFDTNAEAIFAAAKRRLDKNDRASFEFSYDYLDYDILVALQAMSVAAGFRLSTHERPVVVGSDSLGNIVIKKEKYMLVDHAQAGEEEYIENLKISA